MASYREVLAGLSPTHHWTLDTSACEDWIGTLDGTPVNTPTFGQAGLIAEGTSALFASATSELVTLPDHADLKNITSFTVVALLKFTGLLAYQGVFTHSSSGQPDEAGEWKVGIWNTNEPYVETLGDQSWIPGWTPSTGVRYHLAWVWTGSVVRVYIDGSQLDTDDSHTGTIGGTSTSAGQIAGGGVGDPGSFNGTLDEVSFWKNTALTGQNISDLYAAMDNAPVTGYGGGFRRSGRHRGPMPSRDLAWMP